MYIVNVTLLESDCHVQTHTIIGVDCANASKQAEARALDIARLKGIDCSDEDTKEYVCSGNYERYGFTIVITHPEIEETLMYRQGRKRG